ncbi:hypothetical protein J4429_01455 [Candidatus Pacearchaeota archaeon]|nr:hypothetical protein [Candidatus Pacearchaeota archaeon]
MRFVTRKTIDKYLEKVPDIQGGWESFHPQQAIPVLPRIPILNPSGPTYLLYGKAEKEFDKRKPSIDYFYLAEKNAEERRLQQLIHFNEGYKTSSH